MESASNVREVPADLSRAGEARHFISWRAAVAGLGGGRLTDFATAAEAVLTDILLSTGEGALEIRSDHAEGIFRISIIHPEIKERRMADLEEILEKYLDGYEISPTRAVLLKRPGDWPGETE